MKIKLSLILIIFIIIITGSIYFKVKKSIKVKENMGNNILESYKNRLFWLSFQLSIHNIIIKVLKKDHCNLTNVYKCQNWLTYFKDNTLKEMKKMQNKGSSSADDANAVMSRTPDLS